MANGSQSIFFAKYRPGFHQALLEWDYQENQTLTFMGLTPEPMTLNVTIFRTADHTHITLPELLVKPVKAVPIICELPVGVRSPNRITQYGTLVTVENNVEKIGIWCIDQNGRLIIRPSANSQYFSLGAGLSGFRSTVITFQI